MKKLLGLTLATSLLLTGCSAGAEEAVATFETNFANAKNVTFSYQSDGDDYTFKAGDSLNFADTETISFLSLANTNYDKVLTYDEVYTHIQKEINGVDSKIATMDNNISKSRDGIVIEFPTAGLINEDAGTNTTYTYSTEGDKVAIEETYIFPGGRESTSITTVELA